MEVRLLEVVCHWCSRYVYEFLNDVVGVDFGCPDEGGKKRVRPLEGARRVKTNRSLPMGRSEGIRNSL